MLRLVCDTAALRQIKALLQLWFADYHANLSVLIEVAQAGENATV